METDSKPAELPEAQQAAYLGVYHQLLSKYNRVMYSLLVAAVAQAVLYSMFFNALVGRRLMPLALLIAGVPWLAYFVVTLARVPPPISPMSFRRGLLIIMAWYVVNLLVLAAASLVAPIQATGSPAWILVLWLGALIGWLGVPTMYHSQVVLGRHASTSALADHG